MLAEGARALKESIAGHDARNSNREACLRSTAIRG
jgi:hypothetical protein